MRRQSCRKFFRNHDNGGRRQLNWKRLLVLFLLWDLCAVLDCSPAIWRREMFFSTRRDPFILQIFVETCEKGATKLGRMGFLGKIGHQSRCASVCSDFFEDCGRTFGDESWGCRKDNRSSPRSSGVCFRPNQRRVFFELWIGEVVLRYPWYSEAKQIPNCSWRWLSQSFGVCEWGCMGRTINEINEENGTLTIIRSLHYFERESSHVFIHSHGYIHFSPF
jgi:hypothetical protein